MRKIKFIKKLAEILLICCFAICITLGGIFTISTSADGEAIATTLSDFGIDGQVGYPGSLIRGSHVGASNGEKLEMNIRFSKKNTKNDNISIVYCGNDSWWLGGLIVYVGLDDANGKIYLDAYLENTSRFLGQVHTDLEEGDSLKLGLSFQSNGTESSYHVWVNDVELEFSTGTSVTTSQTISFSDNLQIYCTGTFAKFWSIGAEEPITAEDWLSSTSREGSKTDYEENKERIHVYDLEDLIAESGSMSFGFGASRTDDGNIMLQTKDTRTPLIALTAKKGEDFRGETGDYGVRFKSINVATTTGELATDPLLGEVHRIGSSIEAGLELNAQVAGYYWSDYSASHINLRINFALNTGIAEFCPDGIVGAGHVAAQLSLPSGYTKFIDFLPTGKMYTIEYGQFFTQNEDGDDVYHNYVMITNHKGEEIFAIAEQSGSYIYDHTKNGGKVKIAISPYIQTCEMKLLPVDEKTSLLANYNPGYEEDSVIRAYDISDLLPIGQDGITYATTGDLDQKNIINIERVYNDAEYASYMTLIGDYALRLAFFTDRTDGKNATSGYHIVFTPEAICLQSFMGGGVQEEKVFDNPIVSGEKTYIKIRLAMLYVGGVLEGQRISVTIGDDTVLNADLGKQLDTLPTYLDGVMSGNGSVTIYPYSETAKADNGVVATAKKSNVEIGKKVKLDYEISKTTLSDKATFVIMDGEAYAELEYNEKNDVWYLVGKADGKARIAVEIRNEYGTFTSESIEIVVGTGEPVVTSEGCFAAVNHELLGIIVAVGGMFILGKKKFNKEVKL